MAWFTSPKVGNVPPPTGRRQPGPNSVMTGEVAVPRGTAPLLPTPPPSAVAAASSATIDAKAAAERQRKRALAGTTLLTAKPPPGPSAKLQPKTLVGY